MRLSVPFAPLALAVIGGFVLSVGPAHAQTYKNGDTGTFGIAEEWNDNAVGAVLSIPDDAYDARFTALENVTVDRVWQRYVQVPAGARLIVGIQGDAKGTPGTPSGTYLASATYVPAATNQAVTCAPFGPVVLKAGNIYHIVTKAVALPADAKLMIYCSGTTNNIRPYDRATDKMLRGLACHKGTPWVDTKCNPYFALANAKDDNVIGGPGQFYTTSSFGLITQGGQGVATGERFVISDKEVPRGATVTVDEVTFAANAVGDPIDKLLMEFRDAGGQILATAIMEPKQADGKTHTFKLSESVTLQQGKTYLFTTHFQGDSTSNAGQLYTLPTLIAAEGPPNGAATWGGADRCAPITSDAWNNWSTIKPNAPAHDLVFSFKGKVTGKP